MDRVDQSRKTDRSPDEPAKSEVRSGPLALLRSLVVIDPLIILSTIVCGCVSILVSFFDSKGDATLGVARAGRALCCSSWACG